MNAEGWRAAISKAVWQANKGDADLLDGLAQQLAEEDQAKQLLYDAGYGVTGDSLLGRVRAVLTDLDTLEKRG